jgi:hypothetical protein
MTTKTITLKITTSRGYFGVVVDGETECSMLGGSPKQTAKLISLRIERMLTAMREEERKKREDSENNFAE